MQLLRFSFLVFISFSTGTSFSQIITTIAGSGARGFSGDGDIATSAQLCKPKGIAVDRHSNIYVADRENNRVRRIDFISGVITTVAGTDSTGQSSDGVAATTAVVLRPSGVAADGNDNIYFTDESHRIRKVSREGTITTIAGTGSAGFSGDGGPASTAQLNAPADIAIDATGNIYFADVNNNRIRKINSEGMITTTAGTGVAGYNGDSIAATAAQLNAPSGVCIDASDNILIADALNHRIRKISHSGLITTIAGSGVAGTGNDSTLAILAKLNEPGSVAVDELHNIYITDCANHRIRKVIAETGIIVSVCGSGEIGYSGDGGPATAAALYYPACIALDNMGNIYFSDLGNHCIRKISPQNVNQEK